MSGPYYSENVMKKKLRNGEIVCGIASSTGSPRMIEILGYTGTGLDYVVIQTENASLNIGDEKCFHLVRAAELAGLTPLIRMSLNGGGQIKKALTTGSQGIFVVHVSSREDAEKVVDAVKYPSIGHRDSGYGRDLGRHRFARIKKEYIDYWNRESIIMLLVENQEGVENLEDIVMVPGIDVIGIGQGDLSLDLGDWSPRFKNPKCISAVEKLLALCKPRGIAVRDIFTDLETAKKWYEKGVRVFEWGNDESIFQAAVKDIVLKTETLRNTKKIEST